MSIFGQKPADLVDALLKSKNFSDVPDKAAARTNLDVPSKSDVLYSGVPIGTIIAYYGTIAPTGYLPCAGQTINSASFPDLVEFLNPSGSTATIPDLRGEFLRGLDSGRGVDTGRVIGSSQSQDTNTKLPSGIAGFVYANLGGAGGTLQIGTAGTALSILTPPPGETRPRNVAVLYCIKAYNAVNNYVSDLNLSGLVSDYSALMASAVKYADFSGSNRLFELNGYQKLPSGLIVQWGHFTHTAQGQTIPFTINFPTQCVIVVPVDSASGGAGVYSFGLNSYTVSGFNAYSAQGATPGAGGSASFVAIGF